MCTCLSDKVLRKIAKDAFDKCIKNGKTVIRPNPTNNKLRAFDHQMLNIKKTYEHYYEDYGRVLICGTDDKGRGYFVMYRPDDTGDHVAVGTRRVDKNGRVSVHIKAGHTNTSGRYKSNISNTDVQWQEILYRLHNLHYESADYPIGELNHLRRIKICGKYIPEKFGISNVEIVTSCQNKVHSYVTTLLYKETGRLFDISAKSHFVQYVSKYQGNIDLDWAMATINMLGLSTSIDPNDPDIIIVR